MLVLARKVDQTIRIGEHITIIVKDIQSGKVRLAVDAPRDIPVHRGEVYERIEQEKLEEDFRKSCDQ